MQKNTLSYHQCPVTLATLGSNLYLLLYLTYITSAPNQEGDDLLNEIFHFIRIRYFKFKHLIHSTGC